MKLTYIEFMSLLERVEPFLKKLSTQGFNELPKDIQSSFIKIDKYIENRKKI